MRGGSRSAGVSASITVSVPSARKPIRREDILIPFAKALDTNIYTGRVKGKKTLGTFKTDTETVRVKRHADLEVAAHEIAHLIDGRVPKVRQAWLKGPEAKAINKELRAISYDNGKVFEGFAEYGHTMTDATYGEALRRYLHEDYKGGPVAIGSARFHQGDGAQGRHQQPGCYLVRSC